MVEADINDYFNCQNYLVSHSVLYFAPRTIESAYKAHSRRQKNSMNQSHSKKICISFFMTTFILAIAFFAPEVSQASLRKQVSCTYSIKRYVRQPVMYNFWNSKDPYAVVGGEFTSDKTNIPAGIDRGIIRVESALTRETYEATISPTGVLGLMGPSDGVSIKIKKIGGPGPNFSTKIVKSFRNIYKGKYEKDFFDSETNEWFTNSNGAREAKIHNVLCGLH